MTLLAAADGAAVLCIDDTSTPGTIVAATLDPISHYGTSSLPAAGRFLDRFVPWARRVARRPMSRHDHQGPGPDALSCRAGRVPH